MTAILKIKNVSKSFTVGKQQIQVIKDISFEVEDGDFLIIFGPSGCGKSTLLHTMLGLEPPTSGNIMMMDEDLYAGKSEDDRGDLRKKHIGMIYQQANWIKALNVIENVAFPLTLLGMENLDGIKKAMEKLEAVSMLNWANYQPTELSSGQQQRIAVARALVNNPQLIVADEPTGNLDFESGKAMMFLLSDLNQKMGKTIIMVTHDLEYLAYAKSAVSMLDGQVVGQYQGKEKDKLLKSLQFKKL